jgi:hypothetical protein
MFASSSAVVAVVAATSWYGSFLFQAILAVRLAVARLWRVYPAFTLYIISLLTESLVLSVFAAHQGVFGRIWVFSRLIVLPLEALVVLAIFARWTVSFPGIGAFGRGLLAVLTVVSVALALSTLPIGGSRDGWVVAYKLMTVANRVSNFCFASFLLLTIAFFSKFGGPVAPNLRRHSWCMAVFVSANTVSYFFVSTRMFRVANVLLPSISMAALVFWIFAFRKSGEVQPITRADPDQGAVADAMNEQLLKLADSIKLSPRGVKKRK